MVILVEIGCGGSTIRGGGRRVLSGIFVFRVRIFIMRKEKSRGHVRLVRGSWVDVDFQGLSFFRFRSPFLSLLTSDQEEEHNTGNQDNTKDEQSAMDGHGKGRIH